MPWELIGLNRTGASHVSPDYFATPKLFVTWEMTMFRKFLFGFVTVVVMLVAAGFGGINAALVFST